MTNHTLEKPNDWWQLHLIPLKFGIDSCHKTKGRQIPSSTERERVPEALREPHHHILRGALQQGPALAGAIAMAGGRTRARINSSGFSAPFRSRPGVDKLVTPLGINESLAFRAFDKTIIFGIGF